MKSPRVEAVILGVAACIVAVLAYASQQAGTAPPPSIPSTFDTGRNGYRALYEVLRATGLPVRRFGHVLGRLDSDVRTLVITGYENEPESKGLDGRDVDALRRFVQNGGRLVEIDTQFAGVDDIAPRVGTSAPAPSGTNAAIALARDRYTRGVESVGGPIDALFAFGSSVGLPLLANHHGIVATRASYGKGEVVAITAPSLFANAYLGRGENAAFAYNALADHGPIAFDEYVHGFDDDLCNKVAFGLDCLYRALPGPVQAALWLSLATVALALIGANVPFAPAIPLEVPDERDTSAYLNSMAALMRRALAGRAALATFDADARRRGQSKGTPESAAWLAELERLRATPVTTESAVLRAAALDFNLRKEHR